MVFTTKLRLSFGISYRQSHNFAMKRRVPKAKEYHYLLSSAKLRIVSSKINYSVKCNLQKGILYHTQVTQSSTENYCIKLKFDEKN